MYKLNIDEILVKCVIEGTQAGLQMTGLAQNAVGVSRFNSTTKDLTVLVGLHGKTNGNMSMHISRATACFLAEKLLMEDSCEFNEDTLDAVCEIGNMVAGRFKELLMGTEYEFEAISLPAIIFGANYELYNFKNITTATVTFELPEFSIMSPQDKLFHTGISLLRSAGT